ncbi:helix-turn-helix domain-containing protein [Paenibacillus albus]|uniref:MarR family transcriptional regulator n=1 Tax=Paenibacillus albus TaxID=2495582 RepID=A0A3Q8X7P1_9BACL|nr:MarR family transcriptional regulator [Paenibacillus albus]AZN41885.1 MarR family transcriptional regulator [Paenibacillus albus]
MEHMESKRCLFCDELVQVKRKGACEWYIGCICAPGGAYGLREGSFEPFRQLSYTEKRSTFPLISAYIREQNENEEAVVLDFEDRIHILQSPQIPLTSEDKGIRLLRYLHRHTGGPNEPLVISQFAQSYNLTYSPNLQEFVYITEKLKEDGFIERMGSTLKLTEKGWVEAAAQATGKVLKQCLVVLSGGEEEAREWMDAIFPRLIQLGYAPKVHEEDYGGKFEIKPIESALQQVARVKLLITDVSEASGEKWLRIGYAFGCEIPVILTSRAGGGEDLPTGVRVLRYEDLNELSGLLQKQLC